MTVQQLTDRIKEKTGVNLPPDQTCDQLMTGDPGMEVKKIGCTFMATVDVIREAAAQGVNVIITHDRAGCGLSGEAQTPGGESDCGLAVSRSHAYRAYGRDLYGI